MREWGLVGYVDRNAYLCRIKFFRMKLWKRNLRFAWLILCYQRHGIIRYSKGAFFTGEQHFTPRYYSPFYWLMFFLFLPLAIWDGGIKHLIEVLDVYRGYTLGGNNYYMKPGASKTMARLVLLRHIYTSIND